MTDGALHLAINTPKSSTATNSPACCTLCAPSTSLLGMFSAQLHSTSRILVLYHQHAPSSDGLCALSWCHTDLGGIQSHEHRPQALRQTAVCIVTTLSVRLRTPIPQGSGSALSSLQRPNPTPPDRQKSATCLTPLPPCPPPVTTRPRACRTPPNPIHTSSQGTIPAPLMSHPEPPASCTPLNSSLPYPITGI